MGSDWDYINEHMGGHDEDGYPNFMSEPGFSDDESEIKEEPRYFETFQEAMAWAKNNPGQVITRAPDGLKYVGEWKEGEQHGQGTYSWPDGSVYVGDWKENEQSGYGTETCSDGTISEGQWEEGLFTSDKILRKSNMPVVEDDSWIDRLIEWVDENEISEDVFPRDHDEIESLTNLELSNYTLSELPPVIGKLQNLQILGLSSNNLTELPPEIGKLQYLQWLNLEKNNLTELPPEIGKLQNLRWLGLGDNNLAELPPEIGKLQNLLKLNLSDNNLADLSPEIGKLQYLEKFGLGENNLTKLPPEIGHLQNLEVLDLAGNNFTELPIHISNISTLKTVNKIKKESNESTKELLERCGYKLVNAERNEFEISELISIINSFSKSEEEDPERVIVIKSKETNKLICSVKYDRIHEDEIFELAKKIGQIQPVEYYSANWFPSTVEGMTRRLIKNSKQAEETPPIFSKIKRLFGR